jgi:prepilin-type N-terminal cleavage/methylation domain-containing protein
MKINNKGFTLVELIAAFAILGFVILIVGGFITTGANTYGAVAADVNLQYEAQLTMSQIQEYVIDCTGSVWQDGETLYFMKKNTGGTYHAYRLEWDATEKKIYLGVIDYTPGDMIDAGSFDTARSLMSNYVTDFDVELQLQEGQTETDPDLVKTAVFTLEYSVRKETYTGSQTIALRNTVSSAGDFSSFLASATVP